MTEREHEDDYDMGDRDERLAAMPPGIRHMIEELSKQPLRERMSRAVEVAMNALGRALADLNVEEHIDISVALVQHDRSAEKLTTTGESVKGFALGAPSDMTPADEQLLADRQANARALEAALHVAAFKHAMHELGMAVEVISGDELLAQAGERRVRPMRRRDHRRRR